MARGGPGGRSSGPGLDEGQSVAAPKAPLYASLDDYDYFLRDLPTHRKAAAPIWISGGDKAANDACVAIASACKRIAPGIEAAIAVFDEATKDVTLGAPPPPVGKKKRAPAT